MSYFPYNGQNGILSSKSNGKDNELYSIIYSSFVDICILYKNQRIIS